MARTPLHTLLDRLTRITRELFEIGQALEAHGEPKGAAIRMAEIQSAVAKEWGLTLDQLLGRGKARRYARPRQVAMWVIDLVTARPTTEIGRAFAMRDHTTVMHSIRVINHLIRVDQELARRTRSVLEKIGHGKNSNDQAGILEGRTFKSASGSDAHASGSTSQLCR